MAKFCRYCGSPLDEGSAFCPGCGRRTAAPAPGVCMRCGTVITPGAKFCGNCGAPTSAAMPTGREVSPSDAQSVPTGSEAMRYQNPAGPGQKNPEFSKTGTAEGYAGASSAGKKRGIIPVILAAGALVAVLALIVPRFLEGGNSGNTSNQGSFQQSSSGLTSGGSSGAAGSSSGGAAGTGGSSSGSIGSSGSKKTQTKMIAASGFEAKTVTNPAGGGTTYGTLRDSGVELYVENGAFEDGSVISAAPVPVEQLSGYGVAGKYEYIGAPVDISCDTYDGSFFAGDIVLTTKIPGENIKEIDPGAYFFSYYDEKTGTIRNLWPDSFNFENKTMSVELPHFTPFWSSKPTKEQLVEEYLDDYSTKLALARLNQEKAAADMEPYLKAKIDALGLTKEAAKDLLQAALSKVGAGWSFEGDGAAMASGAVQNGNAAAVEIMRGVMENDGDRVIGAMSSYTSAMLMSVWDELEYSKRLDEVLDSEFAGTGVSTVLSNAGSIGGLAAYAMEGDIEGVKEEVSNILQSIHPAAEFAVKGAKLIAAGVNQSFTAWKANKIDELYQVYKNGNDVVEPGDRKSFTDWLVAGKSFFGIQKGVMRFYNMDKIAEICEKYGWSERDYYDLDDRKKGIFNQRAEDSLFEYFDNRMAQEKLADQIKEEERAYIEEMMDPSSGALYSSNYRKFFGEADSSYFDLSARLSRIARLRDNIMQYVDLDALHGTAGKDAEMNEGTVINWYVRYLDSEGREKGTREFMESLEELGLLNQKYIGALPVIGAVDISIFDDVWDIDPRRYGYEYGRIKLEKNEPEKVYYGPGEDDWIDWLWEFEVYLELYPDENDKSRYDSMYCYYYNYSFNPKTGTLVLSAPNEERYYERLRDSAKSFGADASYRNTIPVPDTITFKYSDSDLMIDLDGETYIGRMDMSFGGKTYPCYDDIYEWVD